MKQIIFAALALLMTACAATDKNSYKIVGTTTNIEDSAVVYLSTFDTNGTRIDSTVVTGGQFEFTLPYDSLAQNAALLLSCPKDERTWASALLYAEPGATINVNLDMDEHANCTVGGSPLNDKLQAHNNKVNTLTDEMMAVRKQLEDTTLTDELKAKAEAAADSLYEAYIKLDEQLALDNMDNIIGVSQLINRGAMFSNETRQKLVAMVPEKFQNLPGIVDVRKRLEAEANTAEGKPFTDLEMPNPEGQRVKLSDYVAKSKLTLVDFWASWCGPCRAEIPGMKQIYADYRGRGLQLVGVSFDSKKEAWLGAIKEMQLDYPHMSDLKGWECAASPIYNIQGIPFTLLVSQDGTIVGRNLHGDELRQRIEELLSK